MDWREFFQKWSTEAVCLEAVKNDGDALQYVKEQTEAVCLEAVKRNGYALQYVAVIDILEICIKEVETNES